MPRLLRIALLVVMALLALSLIMAIGRPETGPWEKVTLAGAVVGLTALAWPVHRIG